MNDDFDTTNTEPVYQPNYGSKSGGKGKGVLYVLLITLALVGAAAGGYYWSNMKKDKDIASATAAAKEEAAKNAEADLAKAKAEAKQKTNTATTCNADELSLTTTVSSEPATNGILAYDMVFTNVGKRKCVVSGFPDVSMVNENGNLVGKAAEHAANYTEKELSVDPDSKVKAVVSVAKSDNQADSQCKADVTKLRVYPPSDAGYVSVASPAESWCPEFKVSPFLGM